MVFRSGSCYKTISVLQLALRWPLFLPTWTPTLLLVNLRNPVTAPSTISLLRAPSDVSAMGTSFAYPLSRPDRCLVYISMWPVVSYFRAFNGMRVDWCYQRLVMLSPISWAPWKFAYSHNYFFCLFMRSWVDCLCSPLYAYSHRTFGDIQFLL